MDIKVTTPPTLQSVETAFLKRSKRIMHSSEDYLIQQDILAADEHAEKYANIALMKQTIEYRIERILPAVEIPRPPLIEIKSLSYTPDDGAEVVVDVSALVIKQRSGLALVEIPGVDDVLDGVLSVTYDAGYETADKVPPSIKKAVVLLAGHWYTSRENAYLDPRVLSIDKKISFGFDELISKFRVPNVTELNQQ